MLELRDLTKIYNAGTVTELKLFDHFYLTVDDGQFLSIVGSNGSGKTSLLNIICGSIPIEGGEVLVGGKTFTALASQNLTLKELSNYPLISLSDESMTRSFYRQFFLEHDAVLKPDTEAATTDQMLTLVKSELGLAFVPEPMAKDPLERGEIVQLHLQEIIPTRSICLVYDHHRPLNTAARKFQQLLTASDHQC